MILDNLIQQLLAFNLPFRGAINSNTLT
jgi:hypothetical protein